MDDDKTEQELELEQEETQASIADMLGVEPEETDATETEAVDDDEEVEADDVEETDDSTDEVVVDDDSTDDDDSLGVSSESDEETDEETADADSTELTPLELANQRINSLTELIESQALTALGQKPAETPTASPAPEPASNASAESLAEMIGDLDMDSFADDPAKFVEVITKVVQFTRQETLSDMQDQLPQLVNDRTTNIVNMQKLVDDFYRENDDLSAVKQTVAAVAQNLGAEHPDWDMPKVMEESAAKARTMLGLKSPKKSGKVVRQGKKPAIPKKAKGQRKAAPKKLSKMQTEINDIIIF